MADMIAELPTGSHVSAWARHGWSCRRASRCLLTDFRGGPRYFGVRTESTRPSNHGFE
jgi:hypothetical protein